MNKKVEDLKVYIAQNNLNNFKVEDSKESDSGEIIKTNFHTYIKVFGQNIPAIIVVDDSIYTTIRVQVISDIQYTKNKEGFMNCINEMNISYKAVKYYLGADNGLYLDMYIPGRSDGLDCELVMELIDAIKSHLEKEYPNWMKLLWN